MAIERSFIEASRQHLVGDFLPRITWAVRRLGDEHIWWRPNEASNSIGNLLLHLEGNLRQWIVSGVGGVPDVRARNTEFDATGDVGARELLDHLRAAVNDADDVLAQLDQRRMADRLTIQGTDVTVLEAIYHAVEHFSMHTGQILYIAKLRLGEDLGLYRAEGERMVQVWSTE